MSREQDEQSYEDSDTDIEVKYNKNKNKKIVQLAHSAKLKPAVGIDYVKPKVTRPRRTKQQILEDAEKVKAVSIKTKKATPTEKKRYAVRKNEELEDVEENELPPIIIKRKPRKPQVIVYESSSEEEIVRRPRVKKTVVYESDDDVEVIKKPVRKTVAKKPAVKKPAVKKPATKPRAPRAPIAPKAQPVQAIVDRPVRPATSEEIQQYKPVYAPQPPRSSMFDDCF